VSAQQQAAMPAATTRRVIPFGQNWLKTQQPTLRENEIRHNSRLCEKQLNIFQNRRRRPAAPPIKVNSGA
jgi:hypothetical protein